MDSTTRYNLPNIIVHADWSKDCHKRWAATGILNEDGYYTAKEPSQVKDMLGLLCEMRRASGSDGIILAGFDFPIGLPVKYAERAGIKDFPSFLQSSARGEWEDFYRVGEVADEICLERPFYPRCPGGTSINQLLSGLGLEKTEDLLRSCERPRPDRRAAAPLFWTMGAKQVGKAAIHGWKEVLAPGIEDEGLKMALWPFEGTLQELLKKGGIVIAETYPAEFYRQMGIRFPKSQPKTEHGKRSQEDRKSLAPIFINLCDRCDVKLSKELQNMVHGGFGPDKAGEDRFDAVIGLLGMINVIRGNQPSGDPVSQDIRMVEGWILGQIRGEHGKPGTIS